MKKSILISLLLLTSTLCFSQKELYVSQYMHSRYTLNSAFGGSAGALSVFGAYRKQWAGLNGSPSSQFFSAHTPLKNDKIALGVEVFGQQYAVSKNTGFAASYTYRIRPTTSSWLGLGLNVGMAINSSGWNEVSVKSSNDPSFNSSESHTIPVVGLGAAWYSDRFFAALSVPNFFWADIARDQDAQFAFDQSHLLLTGGYSFQFSKMWMVQPSTLLHYDPEYETRVDVGVNVLFNKVIWVGGTYQTSKAMVMMLGYQILPQFRVIYSWDKGLGSVGDLDAPSHEISLRYEFNYRIPTITPRFF